MTPTVTPSPDVPATASATLSAEAVETLRAEQTSISSMPADLSDSGKALALAKVIYSLQNVHILELSSRNTPKKSYSVLTIDKPRLPTPTCEINKSWEIVEDCLQGLVNQGNDIVIILRLPDSDSTHLSILESVLETRQFQPIDELQQVTPTPAP
ncbi:MAG: hypothetical protein R3A44_27280 [Caldilineaceae bacterium]